MEANWRTAAVHRLNVPMPDGAQHWEVTALYSVAPGIAVERGPFLTLFDPVALKPVQVLSNTGPMFRPTGTFYAVPGFGMVQSVRTNGMLYRVTEKDYSTLLRKPKGFPDLAVNIDPHHRRQARTINGRPCLIWGENQPGVSADAWSISQIVIFDLKSQKVLLRKPLGGDFSGEFLPDAAGKRVYFTDTKGMEIFCVDVKSAAITSFAKLGDYRLDGWVAAD
jgi:hypothetical protein